MVGSVRRVVVDVREDGAPCLTISITLAVEPASAGDAKHRARLGLNSAAQWRAGA
jgi:hypothetical protein